MNVLVDTNIVGELARPRPNPAVTRWFGEIGPVALSVITVDEVFFGLTLRRNTRIERWFESFIDTECNVLEVTGIVARHAGVLRGQLAAKGQTRSQSDMLIAATAATHGLSLATRNERDFEDCGVLVVNPFVD